MSQLPADSPEKPTSPPADDLRPEPVGRLLVEDEDMPAALRGDDKAFSVQILQFFLFPLLIVISVLAIIIVFGISSAGSAKVDDLLVDLREGSQSQRRQAAYYLAKRFSQEPSLAEEANVAPALLEILDSRELTPEMRTYLLLAGSWTHDPRFTPKILAELDRFYQQGQTEQSQLGDREEAYYIALQRLADPAAIEPLLKHYESSSEFTRMVVIHALAPIDDARVTELLRRALLDEYSDVAWNAAIKLAAEPRRDPAAAPTIMKMLDPEYVGSAPGVRPEQVRQWLVYACLAAATLGDPEFRAPLERLSAEDPDPKVKDRARFALQKLRAAP